MNKNYKSDYQYNTIFFQKNNTNLHFVLEKIVSLQFENKSSDFAMSSCLSKCKKLR